MSDTPSSDVLPSPDDQAKQAATRDYERAIAECKSLVQLERENANLRAQLAEAQRDAERFLWMTADHDNADVRERVVNLCNRLPMMSTSAVRMYIDAAMQEGKP